MAIIDSVYPVTTFFQYDGQCIYVYLVFSVRFVCFYCTVLIVSQVLVNFDNQLLNVGYKAVSYTHLDVYKRQRNIFVCSE